jgi:hypothetical protein
MKMGRSRLITIITVILLLVLLLPLKLEHHSHGEFDVYDENGTVVGTIDESTNSIFGYTGDTPEMIRDKFGENGVFVHSPHVNNFEPYKEYWDSQMKYENEHWSTTTNFTLGEEYHIHGRHVGLINITYFVTYDDYTDFKSFRNNITSQGGVIIINHPSHTWIGDPQLFLQPGYEFDGLEIYNGRVEIVGNPLIIPEEDGRQHYRNAVTQGRLLAVIGGSDAHNTDSGWQVYTVAEDPLGNKDLDTVVKAIKNRRTYAAAYDMSTYDRSFFVECDLMGQVTTERNMIINITPPSGNMYTVALWRNNETTPVQSWSPTGSTSITYTVPSVDSLMNAAYTFEIYEGSDPPSSDALAYTTAIWYQPNVTINISLSEGWNQISIPLIQDNTSTRHVLSAISGEYSIVQWYDTRNDSWQVYPGSLLNLDHIKAFWIHMKTDSILTISGRAPFYTTIALESSGDGWNLVGYPAYDSISVSDALLFIEDKYKAIQHYNASDTRDHWKHYSKSRTENDLLFLDLGQGFWIQVIEDCEWTVFN